MRGRRISTRSWQSSVKKQGRQPSSTLLKSAVEVIGTSIQRFLKSVGVTGPRVKKDFMELVDEVEQGRLWLNEGWLPADG